MSRDTLGRRHFIRAAAAGAAAASVAPEAFAQRAGQRRPNILLIMADDLGAKELACYGNQTHRTPNLDRLANTGVMFRTCWATPICSPSRAAIMTGRYGFRTRWYHNNMKFPIGDAGLHLGKSQLIFAELLKSAGYATAVSGKWQLPGRLPDLCHDFGFDEYAIWASVRQLPDPTAYRGPVEGAQDIVPGRTSRYWHPCILSNGKHLPTTEQDYGPDKFADFLIDFMKRKGRGPFLAYYPMCLTHGPHDPTPAPTRPGGKTEGGFQHNVEYMDKIIGRLVKALDDLGLRDNTILFFTADNGTGGQGKGQATELGARVPMIVNCPGTVKARAPSDELVCFADVLPTLADFAGAGLPEGYVIDGKSFAPLLRGETAQHREWIFSYLSEKRMLRDKRWLLEGNSLQDFGRLYDCGDSRDGTGYKEVTDSQDAAVIAARQRFQKILEGLPAPNPNDPQVRKKLEAMKQQKQRARQIRRRKRQKQ